MMRVAGGWLNSAGLLFRYDGWDYMVTGYVEIATVVWVDDDVRLPPTVLEDRIRVKGCPQRKPRRRPRRRKWRDPPLEVELKWLKREIRKELWYRANGLEPPTNYVGQT